MIDWFTVEFPILHAPLRSGMICKIDAEGVQEWASPCRLEVTGSYDSSIQVKSTGGNGKGMATHLWFSANPSKALQGHNIFGSDDASALMYDVFLMIIKQLNLTPTIQELAIIKQGAYGPFTRVDANYSYALPTRSDVHTWIKAAEYKSKTRHGRPSSKGGTVYWGQRSSRWSLKAYCKGDEIEAPKHKLPEHLLKTKLKDWANNKLRIELTLRHKQLQDLGIYQVRDLTKTRVKQLYQQYLRKLEMTEQIPLSTDERNLLPQKLKSTYILWKNGEVLSCVLSKATYYRHRKDLMAYGINIDLIQDKENNSNNVIPLIRVLEAMPAEIPDWAFSENLIHHSA